MTTLLIVGNLALYRILNQGDYADNYELRIDFEDWDGNTSFASYKYFKLGSPAELYRLTVHEYSGNAGIHCLLISLLRVLSPLTPYPSDNHTCAEWQCCVILSREYYI